MAHIHNERPNVLLMFASGANDLPQIRQLIDQLHEIGACPDPQLVVGAGVFNRADGLAEEIGADLWARNPLELVEVLVEEPERRFEANQRSVGRTKKRARRDAA